MQRCCAPIAYCVLIVGTLLATNALAQSLSNADELIDRVASAPASERAALLLEAARAEQGRNLDRSRELAEQSLQAAQETNTAAAIFDAHSQLAQLDLLATRPADALPHVEQLAALLRNPALVGKEAEYLLLRGRLALVERRNDDAAADLDRAIALAKSTENRPILAKSLHNKALLKIRLGQQIEAQGMLEQSLTLNDADGREREGDGNRHYLGIIARDLGDYARALTLHLDVLKHAEARGDTQVIAHTANALGTILGEQNDNDEAIRYYRLAQQSYGKIGDRYSESMALINIANSLTLSDRPAEALAPLQDALQAAKEVQSSDAECLVRTELASAYLGLNRMDEAEREAETAVALARDGSAMRRQQSTNMLARVRAQQKRLPEALELYRQSLAYARETSRTADVLDTALELSKVEAALGRMVDAYGHSEEARKLQGKLHDDELSRRVAELKARYEAERRDAELVSKQARIESLEAQAAQQKRIRLLLAIALGSSILLALALWSRARTKQRAEQALRIQHALVEKANHELAEAADTDALTRTRNRRYLQRELVPQLQAAQSAQRRFAIVLIDADRFKSINDQFGHECGDAALVAIVDAWRSVLDDDAVLVRMGGEEFLAVLFDHEPDSVRDIIGLGLAAVRAAVLPTLGPTPRLTVSAGWVCGPWSGAEVAWLLRLVDQAMLQAKRDGRDRAYGVLPGTCTMTEHTLTNSLSDLDGAIIERVSAQ